MTKEEILHKLTRVLPNIGPDIAAAFVAVLAERQPKFSFALREDLKKEKQFLPTRAEFKATGWDIKAAMDDKKPLFIKPFQYVKIPLGFRAFCPEGWWLELKPRSSSFVKKHLHALYGTIDQDFEGQMIFACQYIPDFENFKTIFCGHHWKIENTAKEIEINFGDAIGQLIPIRRQEMEVVELSNEEYDNACKQRNGQRGAGGFGSTDGK